VGCSRCERSPDTVFACAASSGAAATLAMPFAWRGAFYTRWLLTFMIC
jgi:hypothetical protein